MIGTLNYNSQPEYEVGDLLKIIEEVLGPVFGSGILPSALLITDIDYCQDTPDYHWVYRCIDPTTNLTNTYACYRVDHFYAKVA
jgi:hypothetical protein